MFAGAANTPLACTLLAIELFGGGIGLFAALACAASYACSGHQGIYRAQRLEASIGLLKSMASVLRLRMLQFPALLT
ncbi:MAG: hypothetical protein U1E47_09860 [Rivihabitans pingtungensis]